jgi:hypothetical protein
MRMAEMLHYDTRCVASNAARHLLVKQPAVGVKFLNLRTHIEMDDVRVAFEIQPTLALRPYGRGYFETHLFGKQMFDPDTARPSLATTKHELLKDLTPAKFGFRDDNIPALTADMLYTHYEKNVELRKIDTDDHLEQILIDLWDGVKEGKDTYLFLGLQVSLLHSILQRRLLNVSI